MEIKVINKGVDYVGTSGLGGKLAIKFGPDKPEDDTSMNPVELLGASVCTCIAAMLRKFLNSHDLESDQINVNLVGCWDPGDPVCNDIEITIEVAGDWDDRRRAAFLKVAETCPVHHTLTQCRALKVTVL